MFFLKVSKFKLILILILFMFALNFFHSGFSEFLSDSSLKNGKIFVTALGYMGLSIPTECLSARNPLLEPICLPDIPGGYCYHESCGKVSPVFIGKEYSIEVTSP